MLVSILDHWALWLPLLVVVSLHLLERTQSQAGVIYPKDMPEIMRKRIQIFSFQTQEQFDNCHIKGSKRIDITEIDPDAFMMMIEKKYPILCYCDSGVQSYRYFEHIQSLQKSYWLAPGLNGCSDKIVKYCIWKINDDD
jgi:rhodanese-related sulfurtransferase